MTNIITTQVLEEISKINGEIFKINGEVSKISIGLAEHLAYDKDNREKIGSMYKIIVTGNGCPPLPEVVRSHSAWIEEHTKEQENITKYNQDKILQSKKYNQEETLQNKKDVRADRVEAVAFKRQLWLLAIGQVLTLIGLGVAVFLKW